MLDIRCPNCNSDNTHFSAIRLMWRCHDCQGFFERESESKIKAGDNIPAPMPKNTKNVVVSDKERLIRLQKGITYEIGFTDSSGGECLDRKEVDGIIHELWKNGKRKIYYSIWIPRSNTTGKEHSKFQILDEAMSEFKKL